jgi:hypothetical protein
VALVWLDAAETQDSVSLSRNGSQESASRDLCPETHVGHKDRAKGSLSGQFQVNSYPCSKQLGAWSYAGVCTHAPTSGGRVIGVDGVSDFNALHSGKHNEKVQLCAFDVLALDGDDYLDALPRLRPLPDRSRGPD